MKRCVLLSLSAILLVSGCGSVNEADAEKHTTTVGVCSECGEIQNEEMMKLINEDFKTITETNGSLMEKIADMGVLTGDALFKCFTEADEVADKMSAELKNFLSDIKDESVLSGLRYQIELLDNAIPEKIQSDSAEAVANQTLLYQFYLQQTASSFSYFSDYMDFLSGHTAKPADVMYFTECGEMPKPDSIIYDIQYDSMKVESGVVQYTYLIGNDEKESMLNYNIYLKAIEMNSGLETNINDSTAIVMNSGTMVSAMAAGYDSEKGYILIISFRG